MIDRFSLLIGAMKCGTTSVFRYLAQHPQVAGCSQKEPGFFNDDGLWSRGLDWYCDLWDWNPKRHRWALEGSTEYTSPGVSAKTVDRIATVDAEFRFIYAVRDPVARIESHYNHGFSAGWIPRETAIDDLLDTHRYVVDRTRYAAQLDAYRDRFGADCLLVINFSELVEEPDRQMQRVVEFLELEPHTFTELGKVHNPGLGRIVEHDWITRLRRNTRLYDFLRRSVPRPLLDTARRALGTRLSESFRLAPETRARVVELLADDLDRLRSEYGVDTSKWKLDGA